MLSFQFCYLKRFVFDRSSSFRPALFLNPGGIAWTWHSSSSSSRTTFQIFNLGFFFKFYYYFSLIGSSFYIAMNYFCDSDCDCDCGCSALHCNITLYCTGLFCTVLHCTTWHWSTLHCPALYCTVQCNAASKSDSWKVFVSTPALYMQ